MSDVVETQKLVGEGLAALKNSFSQKNYVAISAIWDDLWLSIRFIPSKDLDSLRQSFGQDISRLVEATRLQIRQKRVRGEIAPRLQSVASKIGVPLK